MFGAREGTINRLHSISSKIISVLAMIPFRPSESIFVPRAHKNPVYQGYFADPFVFLHEGAYYAVGTAPLGTTNSGFEFALLRSIDLIEWESLGGALLRSKGPCRRYWAPEVAEQDGVFYMYYSVGTSDERHELRVATSRRPDGPYLELVEPLLDPSTTPFAIDPHPYRNHDGRWYLFYARDFLDSTSGSRPGTALVVAPLSDMVRLSAEFSTVMRATHDWQRFQANRPIYGGIHDWHTLEGPCVVWNEGRYYCLYSGGNWQNETYGIDFVVADSIDGPWMDTNLGDHPRVLRSVPGHVIGPGHNSIVSGVDGVTYIAYHAWDPAMTGRRFCLDPLIWTSDGPRGLGPTWQANSSDTD